MLFVYFVLVIWVRGGMLPADFGNHATEFLQFCCSISCPKWTRVNNKKEAPGDLGRMKLSSSIYGMVRWSVRPDHS